MLGVIMWGILGFGVSVEFYYVTPRRGFEVWPENLPLEEEEDRIEYRTSTSMAVSLSWMVEEGR